MSPREGMERAEAVGLDLVEVSPNANPPVCKIMDYGKYQYEKNKRAREARKKRTRVVLKEIKFRPDTAEHDYQFKKRHVEDFLKNGWKVRATVRFRGREMVHAELGRNMLARLEADVAELGEVEHPTSHGNKRHVHDLGTEVLGGTEVFVTRSFLTSAYRAALCKRARYFYAGRRALSGHPSTSNFCLTAEDTAPCFQIDGFLKAGYCVPQALRQFVRVLVKHCDAN